MTTQELAHKSLEDIRYHYVSDFLEGTKRISLTLYDHTGLSFPSLEKGVAAINCTAEPYLHKAAQIIDQRLDKAIKNSKQLVGMTKKSLKKIPHDEKLIVQLVKTWLANHVTVGKEGIVQTLSEFINSLNKETTAKLHLDKIKARIGTFYTIASTAWEKLVERNHNDIKRVILEITATSLAQFDNVPTDEHMIACLVNTGEKVMEEKRWITLEEFIPHITLSHAEGDEECKQAQLKLVEKFFNALKQYGKILSASRGINEKVTSACSKNDTTNKWFELVKAKGEDAFSALEHLTAKLHSSVVPSSITGDDNVNGKLLVKRNEQYGNRARNILVQLNEVRLALQLKASQLPPALVAQGQLYLAKLSNLFYYTTMVTLQALDTVYIPIQQNFTKISKSREVVAIKLYLGDKATKAIKMLNDNEKFSALKQCAEIKLAETQIRFKIETVKWKTRSEEVKRDVARLLTELAIILRENKKLIPSRVYNLALDTIRGRLQSRPALPAPNGVFVTPKHAEAAH